MVETEKIDNDFYDSYGERWYTAFDDPVALLRAENRTKIPWILERIGRLRPPGIKLLDVGCGGGFLTNELARHGFQVTGVDLSPESLKVATLYDRTASVCYLEADAYKLPFPDESFDIITNMDFLEHVEHPEIVISECSRVLKENGLFFFHTFNRNMLAKFVIIKLVDWFIKNTPKNMHVFDFFITPQELEAFCSRAGLKVKEVTGLRLKFSTLTWKMIRTGVVDPGLSFTTTKSKALSYLGVAVKEK
jgi:2-polyprenyl-6-hydroxyphenyl methylase / 3-demethylubiquinone-9 3-methyltransferase